MWLILGSFSYKFCHIKECVFSRIGATQRLRQNGLLTPDGLNKADEETIKKLIYPVCSLVAFENRVSCMINSFGFGGKFKIPVLKLPVFL